MFPIHYSQSSREYMGTEPKEKKLKAYDQVEIKEEPNFVPQEQLEDGPENSSRSRPFNPETNDEISRKKAKPDLASNSLSPSLNGREVQPLQVTQKTKNSPLLMISKDIAQLILKDYLYQDLLVFEQVCKKFMSFTERRWRDLTIVNSYNYEWSFNQPNGEPQVISPRDQFLLGRALHIYMNRRFEMVEGLHDKPTQVAKITAMFDAFMTRFPLFGAFVYADLTHFAPVESRHAHIFQAHLEALKKETNAAGNLMLQGLLQFNGKFTLSKSFAALFTNAIRANATCASLYAIQCGFKLRKKNWKFFLDLALESIKQAKDYRGLACLLKSKSGLAEALWHQGMRHPPILFSGRSVNQAFEAYEREVPDHKIPIEVFVQIIKEKGAYGSVQEVEILFNRAFAAYGYAKLIGGALLDAASLKFNLKKFSEAEPLWEKAILVYGENVPKWVLELAAKTKVQLKKWNEAEPLFEKAISVHRVAYGENVPALVLAEAAKTKCKLNKWNESDPLWEKAISAYGENVPAWVLAEAAQTKYELEKWNEADPLWEKAILAHGENVVAWVFVEAAQTKCKLNKRNEADPLWEKAILAYGENVPAWVFVEAAQTKYRLKKFNEADPLWEKAILAYGANVPASLFAYAAGTKYQLKKWNEADPLWEKAILAYKEKVPARLFENAAKTKYQLKKWKEANEYLDQAIRAFGKDVPDGVLNMSAEVKKQLASPIFDIPMNDQIHQL